MHLGKGLGCNGALPLCTVSQPGSLPDGNSSFNRSLTQPGLLFHTLLGQGHLVFFF